MPPAKLEVRGVRCLDCTGLDLKSDPEAAKRGYGCCTVTTPVHFVRFDMRRNCLGFEPADPGVVAARDIWNDKLGPVWTR